LGRSLAPLDRWMRRQMRTMQAQANLRVARYQSMGNLLFWLGIGAAQKGAGSKPIKRRHWVASLIVGILVVLLIAVGMFFLLVSQK
jgi:ATP/ADP translocase